jgi:ABC-type phosphate/phosphonate transport system substrate-binding protein
MIAALPMYDRPENRAAHDELWVLIRDGLRARRIEAPDHLDRATPYDEGWGRPDLVLGQICNLPWRARLRDRVTVIGTSDYGLPDVPPGHYRSVIVARAKEGIPTPPRWAINDPLSCSGWDAPQEWAHANGHPPGSILVTGAHAASVRAVAEGRADLAGIDAITWGMLQRWEPAARALHVIGHTRPTPGMTFITAPGLNPAPYFDAIAEAIASLPPEAGRTLGLRAIVRLPPEAYARPLPPAPVLAPA